MTDRNLTKIRILNIVSLHIVRCMVKIRLPFILFALINLIVGMTAGLIRIGWELPLSVIAVHHGALMVGGFLGTLILLEKVIPLKRKMLLLLPLANALGVLIAVPGLFNTGLIFLIVGSVSLLAIFVSYLIKQPKELSMMMMVAGSLCQIIGHVMLATKQFYPLAFPWWMGFILLVIMGERIELSKFLPVKRQHKNILVFLSVLFFFGLIMPFHGIGKYFSGVSLVLIALWLLRHDSISISIRKDGLTRFVGFTLMMGCCALILTGVFLISLPDLPFAYDAIVHTFFIGFAFSMIYAHGPIILPGVLGLSVKPYHAFLYVPVVLSLSSLIVRLLADLNFLSYSFRSWSGWISVISILLYFFALASLTIVRLHHGKAV